MSRLHRYLNRLQDTILSRREIEIEIMEIIDQSDIPEQESKFAARLSFPDGSQLRVIEALRLDRSRLVKSRYVYHYQQADGTLIFRYDNAPHHPELKSHPHHKHLGANVVAAKPPDLSQVLQEIDELLYPQVGSRLS
jgi:hypothetical protein